MNGWLRLSCLRTRIPWMIAAVLALSAPAQGAAPQIRIEPTTLYFGAATPPAVSAIQEHGATGSSRPVLSAALKAKAADGGTVRVIVQLSTPFTPEGRLAGTQIRGQRQAIGLAQDAVLQKLLGQGARLQARYGHIPFLALEVDAAALDRLAAMPEVTGISEDVFEKPSLVSSNAVIGSGVAWAMGLTGAGQTIAILDTGVDKTHP